MHIRGAGNVKRTGSTQPASLDELAALADATPERYRLMVLLAAWCALRKGELSELRRSDVDTTHWVVRVRRGVGFVPGRIVVKDPKTQAGKRDVAIPEHLIPDASRTTSFGIPKMDLMGCCFPQHVMST